MTSYTLSFRGDRGAQLPITAFARYTLPEGLTGTAFPDGTALKPASAEGRETK